MDNPMRFRVIGDAGNLNKVPTIILMGGQVDNFGIFNHLLIVRIGAACGANPF